MNGSKIAWNKKSKQNFRRKIKLTEHVCPFCVVQNATLTCHTYQVMYVAVSPDGQTIVNRVGDEP
ncbi:unnamed protein product [Brassica napus]|uniref:(rape) hypothetical protein n=1 Tax=Brassica napus TaxID=3708 RepID=A0A816K098_BRANA|nr:unnamed protein product [Brassica napus]